MRIGGRGAGVAGAAVAALIAGGGTYALAGPGSGTLSACVHTRGGALYEARRCARRDRRLTWNIAGPQGTTGPAGVAGKNGANGINGTNGTNGIGATTYPVSVPYGTVTQDIVPLGQGASLYVTCNRSPSNDYLLLGVDSGLSWHALGSYSAYTLGSTVIGDRQTYGAPGNALYSYPIAGTSGPLLYEVQSTTAPPDYGYYSGTFNVTISGASTSYDHVDFNLFSVPGSTGGCQGVVTAYPA